MRSRGSTTPDFEVLVIDNNTDDPAGVAAGRGALRDSSGRVPLLPRRAPLAGFKAGALELRAARTPRPTREIVAVIDSRLSWCEPGWLRDLVPAFAAERIGIVQAPQDYRDAGESAFKAMCYAEYRGFFHIGMITRNERNAIIQHGTMTLVRRSLLEADRLGGMVHHRGCGAGPADLRAGLRGDLHPAAATAAESCPTPSSTSRSSASRWAYGAMQILRRHFDLLIQGRGSKG